MRRVSKATAQRYSQLLTGHAAIGSFPHDRMTGPQRLGSDERWWCCSGARQSRHHLFMECSAWAPRSGCFGKGSERSAHWEHSRAPALRWLWREAATGAVLDFLESTRVGCRVSAEISRLRVDEDRGGEDVWSSEG